MTEFLKEVRSYLLGVAVEGGKGKGWKGNLYLWPFVLFFLIVLGLIFQALLRLFL